nr:aspartate--trna ligase, cytoplasmic [Quercus suber]
MSSLKKALTSFGHSRSASTSEKGSDTDKDSHHRVSTSLSRRNGSLRANRHESPIQSPGSPRASREHHRMSMSPMGFLRRKARGSSSDSHSTTEDLPLNRDGEPMSRNQQRKHEKQVEKEQLKRDAEQRQEEARKRKLEMEKRAEAEETPEQRAKYGVLPINSYAGEPKNDQRVDLRTLTPASIGQTIVFRARVHNLRKMSAHLMFVELRQQTETIQGILAENGGLSPHFLYWAEHLHVETVVRVKALVQEPKSKQGEIISVSIHNLEVHVLELHVEAQPTEPLPFTVHEAEVSNEETRKEGDARHRVSDRARQHNRIIDLRTTASQGIFRIQSGVCYAFRNNLSALGFIEIHTPKLQGAASESGASVFKVDYFGRPAFLAQSPQLGKQMAISGDMRRVFEIGPVFRAENSNTHRHLTEFTGLDLEMAIDEHYHEVLRVLDSTFKAIFKHIYDNYKSEIEVVKRQFPHEDLVWLDETPIIPFAQGIRMLNETGHLGEDGKPLPEDEDLGTRDEIALGRVIKEKLGTDYYVLDKFPASARPFYAMPDPSDPKLTNSFDIFLRGQEILSGGQRIHDAVMLEKKMESLKMNPKDMEEYMTGFEWGAPPHGGGGIGMERILMLLLKLGDIRHATMFPRDPRSLPYTPPVKQLRHPESSTLDPPWSGQDRAAANVDFQPLEHLIANYGDASNTSWLEPKFEIWRDEHTGAAIGFVPQDGFAITIGNPLCHTNQYIKTIGAYLRYIKKERRLKTLWLLGGPRVEEALANRFDWRTFSVAAEQRVDLENITAAQDPEIQRKIRHAEKEGVKVHDVMLGTDVPQDFKDKIDARVQDWLKGRKGKQVHLTDVHPWQDSAHRQYHYCVNKEGTIVSLVILAQLSPENGWQVKFSLEFPGAPNGAIEQNVMHALKAAAATGATTITFGGGASSKFTAGHNLKGARVKVLSRAYQAIATDLKLLNKSEFREKFGAKDDPIYICYPPHGLGPSGVRAIMSFFGDEDDAVRIEALQRTASMIVSMRQVPKTHSAAVDVRHSPHFMNMWTTQILKERKKNLQVSSEILFDWTRHLKPQSEASSVLSRSTMAPTTIEANGITINYLLQDPSVPTTAPPLVVLINGLADDLDTWGYQIPALLAAGYRVLSYDNRGVGKTSRPPGPYTAALLAADLHALLGALHSRGVLDLQPGFHLLGVSMGGMIAQAYALAYPNDSPAAAADHGKGMLSLSLCCTYAAPSTFCTRMFAFWADVARAMGVRAVMRDVMLWAFTVPFFRTREEELAEVETAMQGLDLGLEEYLAQLHVIQEFDTGARLEGLKAEEKVLGGLGEGQVMVLAGKTDILIPVVLSKELQEKIEGSRWVTTKGGHGCMWEFADEFNKTIIAFLDEQSHKTNGA